MFSRNNRTILFPIISGFLAYCGQVILLRELMIAVKGNEIVFAIFFSLWLLSVSLGAFLSKKRILKKDIQTIRLLIFALILLLPIQSLLIHFFTPHLSIVKGMILNIPRILLIAGIILIPISFLIGWLFPLNCRLHKMHKVYILESLGMVSGGIFFISVIHFLSNFQIMLSASLIGILLFALEERTVIFLSIPIFLILLFSNSIFHSVYENTFVSGKLKLSEDSRFGRFDITDKEEQENYFWNGNFVSDSGDKNYAEEMMNFILLQHPDPEEILVAGGLIHNYEAEIPSGIKIDFVELDKNIIDYFGSGKANYIQSDLISYLQRSSRKYDLLIIDVPDPTSLFLNRFYTKDFFQKIKKKFKDENSVCIITVSNSANFLLPELAELNAVIYRTFAGEFENCLFIPAEKVLYFGSRGDYISNDRRELIMRMKKRKLEKKWFNEGLIMDRCFPKRLKNFSARLESYPAEQNLDLQPKAYLLSLSFWLKQLGTDSQKTLGFMRKYRIPLLITFVVFLLLFTKIMQTPGTLYSSIFNLVSISLIAFISQLVLIFLVQIDQGFVYYIISIFTLTFMIGLTTGFALSEHLKITPKLLMILYLSCLVSLFFLLGSQISVILLLGLNIAFSFLEGATIFRILTMMKNINSNRFYFLDTIGATFGGIVFGFLLLPHFHFRNIILFLIIFLSLNIGISLMGRKRI